MRTLHVVIPSYDERETLEPCVRRVLDAPLPDGWRLAIELVDDHSAPDAAAIARDVVEALRAEGHAIELTRHDVNRGKGAALQTGFDRLLDGRAGDDDVVIVQDADLEYDPADYEALLAPIATGRVEAVIGTRWGRHRENRGLKRKVHALGNAMLTTMSNVLTGYRVTDMECCYKLLTMDLLRRVRPMLTETRFGIEPQLVASLSRLGARLEEVPVRYEPRGRASGKKIGWSDAVRAVHVMLRERLRPARRGETAP